MTFDTIDTATQGEGGSICRYGHLVKGSPFDFGGTGVFLK